jgi:hypothetical protein
MEPLNCLISKWDICFADYLVYDESSPSRLSWKPPRMFGRQAGTQASNGYWHVMVNYKSYPCHRVVWQMRHGALKPGEEIDHIDGNPANCDFSNLRIVSKALNLRNRKMLRNNKSGTTGVTFTSKKGRSAWYDYWEAAWMELDGRYTRKTFSILRHGNDEAFRLACEARHKAIEELNSCGAGYTERHGVVKVVDSPKEAA